METETKEFEYSGYQGFDTDSKSKNLEQADKAKRENLPPWKYGTENDYWVRSNAWSAPGCHPVGCGIKLHVVDGKLVEVEGDENHPVTQGRLCPRCLCLPEVVNHPQRITHPMLRVGEKGENKWKRITWDEAMSIAVEKIRYYQETYGPESIMLFHGTGRQSALYSLPLTNVSLGTPNHCYAWSGWSCYGPRCAITDYVLGAGYPEIDYAGAFEDRFDNPEFELPEYIIIWGKMPLSSNPDGFFGHAIIDLMKLGTKIICIDPRAHWLATRSEYHLQIRPGSDTALALGFLNVVINEDLYDHEFVEKWCYGFDELKERVQEYPPDKVAELTWIPEDLIVTVAREFAQAKNGAIQWGLVFDMTPNGVQLGHAMLAFAAITGKLDIPGGITLGMHAELFGAWREESAKRMSPDLWEKRIGAKDYPAMAAALPTTHPDVTLEVLETAEPYRVRMAWISSSNLLANTSAAQPTRWYNAMKQSFEYVIQQEIFLTPTASAMADMILPLTTFAEADGVVLTHFGRNIAYMGAINKALTVGECKSDLEITMELSRWTNPDDFEAAWLGQDTPEDFINAITVPGCGLTLEEMRKGVWQPGFKYRKYETGGLRPDGLPGFNTTTGMVELCSVLFPMWGEDPLPYFQEPPQSPYSTPELYEEYPLILTIGARKYTSFHSEHRQIATLRDIDPWPTVEIHPDTAAKYGIRDGDWVEMENTYGHCRQVAKVTPIVDPRVIQASHGWWYPEEDMSEPNLGGVWKSSTNSLIPHRNVGKLGFGNPGKALLCKIRRVDGKDDNPMVP